MKALLLSAESLKRQLPDDFTVEIPEWYLASRGVIEMHDFEDVIRETTKQMILRGYTVFRWRNDSEMTDCIRFLKSP